MISNIPRGTPFVRAIISAVRAGPNGDAAEVARNAFGDRVSSVARGIVSAGSISSGGWGAVLATPEHAEFFAAVQQQSILGKLVGLRTVPLRTRLLTVAAGMVAYWVGRGAPKPLSKGSLAGSTLPPLKVAGLFAVTQELVRHTSQEAETLLRNDLVRAIAEELDRSFIDADNAGVVDEQPASVTNGVTPIASTGSPGSDVAALIEAFTGDLMSAAFVTDPVTAAGIALARDAGGGFLFPDAGPRGGSILGIPLVVSRSSPRTTSGGQLALVDASGIAYGAEGVRIAVSDRATLAMQDDPESPIEQVSLFQTNTAAILAEAVVNWEVQREGSVAVVSDALYATGAS